MIEESILTPKGLMRAVTVPSVSSSLKTGPLAPGTYGSVGKRAVKYGLDEIYLRAWRRPVAGEAPHLRERPTLQLESFSPHV